MCVCFMIVIEHGMVMMCEYECHDMSMMKIVVIMLCLIIANERETCVILCALYVIEIWHRLEAFNNGKCKGTVMRIVR